MNVHVVKNHFDNHIVGCKITIPEGQKGVIENNAFWPKGIQCRGWGKKIKQDRVGENGTYKTIVDSSGNRLWVPVDNDVDQSANLYQRSSRQNSRNIDSD